MAKIGAGDFKNGLTLMIEGKLLTVIEFQHVKPGKGAAILKTKMKDMRSGNIIERNFNTNETFETVYIEKKKVQFSYKEGTDYNFMDMETYDMYTLGEDQIENNKFYLLEGMELDIRFFESEVLDVILPDKVELTIVETTPAAPGASATSTKDAVLETGLRIKVPQFINQDEKVIISTIDGTYAGRA